MVVIGAFVVRDLSFQLLVISWPSFVIRMFVSKSFLRLIAFLLRLGSRVETGGLKLLELSEK